MHHARNTDEHGVDEISSRHAKALGLRVKFAGQPDYVGNVIVTSVTDEFDKEPHLIPEPGTEGEVEILATRRCLKLRTVHDREGNAYEPPPPDASRGRHQMDAFEVADAALETLREIVEKAGTFPISDGPKVS